MRKFKLGVVVNPYAGIGGAMAFKGSDGELIRSEALSMGAEKKANDKALLALRELQDIHKDIEIFTAGDEMGESICQILGYAHHVVYRCENAQSEAIDTIQAVKALVTHEVDLVLFAGGDGTARNVYDAVAEHVTVLGIPAGCKIHSGVYAITPSTAGRVVKMLATGQIVSMLNAEVKDIDEQQFRQGKVQAKHYGEMRVPEELRYVQAVKMGGKESEELVLADIAADVIEHMEEHPEALYVMGSGSTVSAIQEELGIPNTLLGVDVIKNKQLVAQDVTANTLKQYCSEDNLQRGIFVVITPIGGQGHILGRGNQQLSAEFIRTVGKQNLIVVATKTKLESLNKRPLISDSGDPHLDLLLSGQITITTGYRDKVLYPLNMLEE